MIFFPFLYFLVLLICLLRKRHKIDIASYILVLYTLCSFFGILNEFFDLRYIDQIGYQISLEATGVYCLLLTVFWLPIFFYTQRGVDVFYPVENVTALKIIAILSFAFFVITFVGSYSNLVGVLTGDMLALRHAVYAGEAESAWFVSLPAIVRTPIVFGNMCLGCFWILQFLSFFCMFVQKIEIKYSLFFMIASLLGPLWGILAIDRSRVCYWILALIANYIFFSGYMSEKEKRILKVACSLFVILLVVYLSMMTNARFENRHLGNGISGSLGSVVTYVGQSFVNFAYFYDEFDNETQTFALIFPFFHKYALGSFGSAVEVQEFLSSTYRLHFGLFYTFLGQILISAGKVVMVLYALLMMLLGSVYFKPLPVKQNSLLMSYLFMAYSSIMFLGLFVHYYANAASTFSVVVFALLFKFLTFRKQ